MPGEPIIEPVAAEAPAEAAPAPAPAPSAIEAAPEAAPEAAAAPEGPEAAPEAKPEAPPDPAPDAAAAEVAPETPAPVYDFKAPEGVEVTPERLGEFTTILSEFKASPELGQRLLDLHATTLKQGMETLEQRQRDVFDQTRAGWRSDVNREFGNRRDTVVNDARAAIVAAFPDPKERAQVYQTLAFTGAGDHPKIIKLIGTLGARLRERPAPGPGTPPKGQPLSKADQRYNVRT